MASNRSDTGAGRGIPSQTRTLPPLLPFLATIPNLHDRDPQRRNGGASPAAPNATSGPGLGTHGAGPGPVATTGHIGSVSQPYGRGAGSSAAPNAPGGSAFGTYGPGAGQQVPIAPNDPFVDYHGNGAIAATSFGFGQDLAVYYRNMAAVETFRMQQRVLNERIEYHAHVENRRYAIIRTGKFSLIRHFHNCPYTYVICRRLYA